MGDERKEPLRLVDGKFMRGNVEEKPEIGNVEQIALLQRQEKYGIEVTVNPKNIRYDADFEFRCLCGDYIHETECGCSAYYADELEDCADELDIEEVICEKCGRRYEIQGGFAKPITKR